MTLLSSLNRIGERMEQRGALPTGGFSSEKISCCISLNADGSVAGLHDLRDVSKKKPVPRVMGVPQAVKRTAGVKPNFLWDKTSYVLGVTAGDGKRLAQEHAAFVDRHLTALAGSNDVGLHALLLFLQHWRPELYAALGWPEELKDQNVVFALEDERHRLFLHDRPAAKALWARLAADDSGETAICLVTGDRAPVARLHPSIKGVWGAQSSGASLVSFNLDAFTSYGHEQGANAPVSEAVAARYTAVLNAFLARDSGHRVQIGDASTVFWADASDAELAEQAESVFGSFLSSVDEDKQSRAVGDILEKVRQGERIATFNPALSDKVRFYVLGLAPNAARLSVRFYLEDTFGALIDHYQRFLDDIRVEPGPRQKVPQLWQYLRETAALGKEENISPLLAGNWMRSILTGTPYPQTLFATVLMRIRADGEINALRVGILKALLLRNFNRQNEEVPVAFDPDNDNKGYLLGRLFAVYERVQSAALGDKLNSTIKDKYYGAASAQPQRVFAALDKGAVPHLSRLGKDSPGYRVNLEKLIGEIMGRMSPGADPFPATLSSAEQALFALGYYHQRNDFFKKSDTEQKDAAS